MIQIFLKYSVLVMALNLALNTACSSNLSPAEKSAGQFMDAYYRDADLPRAKSLSAGLAAYKIGQELELGAGKGTSRAQKGRRVTIKKRPQTQVDDPVSVYYDVKIEVADQEFKRSVQITLRPLSKDSQVWKVNNFAEVSK